MVTKAVSTWSLHRSLGSFWADDPVTADRSAASASEPTSGMALIDLPAELRRRDFDVLQICHFHLPTRDPGYLAELRAALADARIELDAVLVDDGDLTHPTDADDHEAWIAGWLEDSVALGAHRARVIAGKSAPTPERLNASSQRLARLAREHPDVRVVTENWLQLMPTAADVHAVLEPTEGSVGFLIDLGNWTGADKYAELESVAPLAETCHAKGHFDNGEPNAPDFERSLQTLRDCDYDGPLALIYDSSGGDEWGSLEREHAITNAVFT
ncbi:MAG TPA: TIM barrel protein [Actinopolymorphaceae bacterium]|jgi:sugar phosphate isomerase/epimerase